MSFFIKGKAEKKKYASSNKYQKRGPKKKTLAPPSANTDNHKISSDDDEEHNDKVHKPSSEDDEIETAQEKKLRLAKVYLEEIEKEERKRLTSERSDNENGDIVSKRLKTDYLKQAGKLKQSVADQYSAPDISNIKVLRCNKQHTTITCICLSTDDNFIFSGCKNGTVVKWSLPEYKQVAHLPFVKKAVAATSKEVLGHSKQITCITISSDNAILVVGDASKDIKVWNAHTFKHMGTLKGHRDSITGVAIRQSTHTLYSSSKDRSVKVWSLDEMSYIETLYGHQDSITAIDALSRERAITSGGRDCTIRIWKIAEESQLIYNGHSGSIDIVHLINEENFISGGDDGQICIWSSMKKKPLCSVKQAHSLDSVTSQPLWITAVTSLLNTDLVASGSYDGFIRIWKLGENFRSVDLLFTVEVTGFVNDLSFTSDGKCLIAAVGNEHRFGRWNVIKSAKNSIMVIPLLKT